jgi:hypothetical protein
MMSVVGPSRRFRGVAEFGRYRGHSGLWQAVHPAVLWVHGLVAFVTLVVTSAGR